MFSFKQDLALEIEMDELISKPFVMSMMMKLWLRMLKKNMNLLNLIRERLKSTLFGYWKIFIKIVWVRMEKKGQSVMLAAIHT